MHNYHKVFKFDNGYGASVISGQYTYGGNDGKFEIAVLDSTGDITYDTPITSDVIGWLDFGEVDIVLEKIKNLPVKKGVNNEQS